MIGECLESLRFADEIVIVDTGNTDRTNEIGRNYGAKIVKYTGPRDYSGFRNAAAKKAKGDWLLYIDADERVTEKLAVEIKSDIIGPNPAAVYALPRKNIYLGKELKYGGWGGDYVTRLIRRSALKTWTGILHEQPEYTGRMSKLNSRLTHVSHRDLSSMLEKSLIFTENEALLRLKADHPRLTWWRFFRVMFTEFWYRFIKLSAWRDGTEGVIDGIFQVFNTFIIYARLWEMQINHDHDS